MLKNYLKSAWRNMRRRPGYTFITIFGLAVGLASCLTILLWVRDELGYDRFHANAGSIHRVIAQASEPGGGSESFAVLPPNLGPALQAEFPEVRQAARLLYAGQQLVAHGEKRFYEKEVSLVDPGFLQIFTFPLRRGDARSALAGPRSIVLTESAAAKYFGGGDPLGQTLRLNNRSDYTVTGILADLPAQSHLAFTILLPAAAAREFGYPNVDTWTQFSYETYVLLQAGADARALEKKIAPRLHGPLGNRDVSLRLQPLADIHLRSASIREGEVRGDIGRVLLFSLLAAFILFMACINYLNLATAQGSTRAREIGLRKVNGASRREIVVQFLGESLLQAALAMVLAVVLIALCLPLFNSLTGKEIRAGSLLSFSTGLPLLGFVLVTGLLAGIYPALVISRLRPAAVLKGRGGPGGGSRFRRALVVFQFALTIMMIIGSVTLYRQMRFLGAQKLGFDREQILMVPVRGELAAQVEPLKAEILRNSSVAGASAASDPVMMYGSTIALDDWEGRKPGEEVKFDFVWCDEDYLRTHGMEMAQGRFFTRTADGGMKGKIVLSESAVRALGMASPIGRRLDKWEIIGVVRDFHARSLHSAITPVAMVYDPAKFGYLFIKLKPGNIAAALAAVGETWKRAAPEFPFDFAFLDQQIDKLYRAERKLGGVVNGFAVLALLVANLGLLGMAAHLTIRRRKEIGVRKALGATMAQILLLLSGEFTRWVAWAAVIACPVAWLVLNRWLRLFAYRISIGIGIFAVSILAVFAIAWLTVSYQAIRAAAANPTDSLRYE